MTNYKVSIGVPVYNAANYIERCVNSILSQSYEDIDVVFVDDGSMDDSVSIIEKVVSSYPQRINQVRIIRHKENQGVSEARNTLLSAFTGEFFSFVDADDYLLPDAIQKLVAKQRQNDSDIVTGKIRVDDLNGSRIIEEPNYEDVGQMLLNIVSSRGNHENVARIYRTKIVKDYGVRYPEHVKIGEDWLYLVNYVRHAKKVSCINDIIYIYDYTNQQSAMHSISKNYGYLIKSDIIVLHDIKKVIIDKGRSYNDALEQFMARLIEDGLMFAYHHRDRKLFNELKYYIKEIHKYNIDDKYRYKKLSIGSLLYLESYRLYFWLWKQRTRFKSSKP